MMEKCEHCKLVRTVRQRKGMEQTFYEVSLEGAKSVLCDGHLTLLINKLRKTGKESLLRYRLISNRRFPDDKSGVLEKFRRGTKVTPEIPRLPL